jgi:hypothetical protein
MSGRGILIFCLYSFLVLVNAKAQDVEPKTLKLSLSQNEFVFKDRSMQTLTIKIINHQDSPFKGMVIVAIDESVELISRKEYPVDLKAGDSLFISIRFSPTRKIEVGKTHALTFTLKDDNHTYAAAVCNVKMNSIKNVSLISMVSSLILGTKGDSIQIPVKISNNGNTLQKVSIVCQLPPSSQNNGFHTALKFSVRPFTDTLIYFNKSVTRDLLRLESFNINLYGIYENGDLFGQNYIQVQSLKNQRSFNIDLPTYQYQGSFDNSYNLTAQNVGQAYASYQLYGGGTVETPYGRIGLNTDATVWKNTSTPYLRNTYLSFEGQQMGITAGNISKNLESNLNGRGINVFYLDTAAKNNYEVGMVDRSSNFIDPYQLLGSFSKAMWARFKHHKKKLQYTNTAMYEADYYTRANNTIIANEFTWTNTKNIRFFAELNAGHTADQGNSANHKLGYLGTFNTDGKLGQISFNSSNTFSTAYYPGMRRGARNFNERLNYSNGKFGFWGSYNYLKFKPAYIAHLNFSNEFASKRADLGTSVSFNQFLVSISPLYSSENSLYTYFQNSTQGGSLSAFRLSTQLNYTNQLAKLYLFLTVEGGVSSDSFSPGYKQQFKLNGNVKWGPLNITGGFQNGNFYVSELLNNQITHITNNQTVNLTTTLIRNFFNKKVEIEAGVSYYKTSASGNSLMFTGRAAYQVNSRTKFFSTLLRTEYKYINYNYNNLQLGISRTLPTGKIGSKNNTLTVQVYKDINQNGVYDEGDLPAKGQIVYVDHVAFLTTAEGKITYKNLVSGNYTVSLPNVGNWYAAAQPVVINKADLKLEIPLSKTGIIEGKIDYSYSDYSYEVEKEKIGLKVVARNINGKIEITKTNELGRFAFYLPNGKYMISIEDLPEQIVCIENYIPLSVNNEAVQKMVFTLKIKERKVEVKKFSSPSLIKNKKQ